MFESYVKHLPMSPIHPPRSARPLFPTSRDCLLTPFAPTVNYADSAMPRLPPRERGFTLQDGCNLLLLPRETFCGYQFDLSGYDLGDGARNPHSFNHLCRKSHPTVTVARF
jgi:hypothetical protein